MEAPAGSGQAVLDDAAAISLVVLMGHGHERRCRGIERSVQSRHTQLDKSRIARPGECHQIPVQTASQRNVLDAGGTFALDGRADRHFPVTVEGHRGEVDGVPLMPVRPWNRRDRAQLPGRGVELLDACGRSDGRLLGKARVRQCFLGNGGSIGCRRVHGPLGAVDRHGGLRQLGPRQSQSRPACRVTPFVVSNAQVDDLLAFHLGSDLLAHRRGGVGLPGDLGLDGGNVVVLLSPHEILRVLKSCSIVRDLAAEPGTPAQIAPDRLLQRKAGGAHLHRGPGGSHRRFPGGVNAPGLGVEAQGPLRHGVNDDATGDSPALPQILLVIAEALVSPYGDEAHGRCPRRRVQCIQPLSDSHLVEVIRAVGVLQV